MCRVARPDVLRGIILAGAMMLPGCAPKATSVASIAGTYRNCLLACATVTLREDGTFVETLTGDMWTGQTSRGTWREARDGFIVLNSDAQPDIVEKTVGLGGDIRFTVVDTTGAPVELAYGFVDCPESVGQWTLLENELYTESERYRLGQDGYLYVSSCRPKEFSVELYTPLNITYTPRFSDSDHFEFTFDTSVDFYVTDELLRVDGDELIFFLDNDPARPGEPLTRVQPARR